MAKRRFGDLSKQARERAARVGRERFGLNRRQVRERYNRGTYNPYSRSPGGRVPLEFRAYRSAGSSDVDWQEAAEDNLRRTYEDYYKSNEDTIVYNAAHMGDELARVVSTASEDDLSAWASVQPDAEGNPPDIETWHLLGLPDNFTLEDVSVYINGEWHNIFWYH